MQHTSIKINAISFFFLSTATRDKTFDGGMADGDDGRYGLSGGRGRRDEGGEGYVVMLIMDGSDLVGKI